MNTREEKRGGECRFVWHAIIKRKYCGRISASKAMLCCIVYPAASKIRPGICKMHEEKIQKCSCGAATTRRRTVIESMQTLLGEKRRKKKGNVQFSSPFLYIGYFLQYLFRKIALFIRHRDARLVMYYVSTSRRRRRRSTKGSSSTLAQRSSGES